MDMKKVIKALECRLDINGSKYKHCLNCDYRHDIDHCQWACQTDGILEDALALLKAQEPVKPVVDIDTWKCGDCRHTLEHQQLLGNNVLFHEQYNSCPECGRPVKWE